VNSFREGFLDSEVRTELNEFKLQMDKFYKIEQLK
jgi:hypothetical protein